MVTLEGETDPLLIAEKDRKQIPGFQRTCRTSLLVVTCPRIFTIHQGSFLQ